MKSDCSIVVHSLHQRFYRHNPHCHSLDSGSEATAAPTSLFRCLNVCEDALSQDLVLSPQIFWSWFWLVHATQHGPLIGTDHLTLNIMQPTAYRILMPRNAAQDSVLTRNRKYQFMALPFVSGFRALSHTKYVFQPPAEQVKSPGRVNSLTNWGICKLMPR